jgi:hypothetical protein
MRIESLCACYAKKDAHIVRKCADMVNMGAYLNNPPIKVEAIAVNEPRTLKVVVPTNLYADGEYYLKIVTQSTVKGNRSLLNNTRETWTDFVLTTQNPRP